MMIGNKIRHLRQDNGYTLEELSKKSGIALATLSRIENEKMIGTLESHQKISKALGITLSQLFAGLESDGAAADVQTQDQRTDVTLHNTKYTSETLISRINERKIMPILISIQPHGETESIQNKVGTEKFIYVFEGELEVSIGKERFRLSDGDTLYFNASFPHKLKNTGKVLARCICVNSL